MPRASRRRGRPPSPRRDRRRATASSRSFADRVCNGFVWAFASWTFVSNAIILSEGTLRHLVLAAMALLLVGTMLGAVFWTHRSRGPAPPPAQRGGPESGDAAGPPIWQRLLVVSGSLATAFVWFGLGRHTAAWMLGAALISGLVLREATRPPRFGPARESPLWDPGLIVLSVACTAIALVANRSDPDDGFYGNFALSAATNPDAILMSSDTIHGIPGLPILPVYRLHSLEPLEAVLTYVLGAHPLDVLHLGMPILGASLLPFAYARLLRILLPHRWIWGVVAVVAFYLLVAGPELSYSNLALVRIHQGRSIFLAVLLPLIVSAGVEFARSPSIRGWLLLAATQVASLGTTSTALWCAPVIAVVSVACGVSASRRGARTLLHAVLSSGYLVAMALWARETVATMMAAAQVERHDLFEQAAALTLGPGPAGWLGFVLMLGTWSVAASPLARRFAAFFSAAFLIGFWNPFLSNWIAMHVTSTVAYWRVFWLVPVPVLFAIFAISPLTLSERKPHRRRVAIIVGGAMLLGSIVLPLEDTLSEANRVRLGWPTWKASPDALAAARSVVAHASPHAWILAPTEVATLIVALPEHPYPLVVQTGYLDTLEPYLGEAEIVRRRRLELLVSGFVRSEDLVRNEDFAGELRAALDAYPLAVVCLQRRASRWVELRATLVNGGFRIVERSGRFQVWARAAENEGASATSARP